MRNKRNRNSLAFARCLETRGRPRAHPRPAHHCRHKNMSVTQPESGVHHRPRKNHCAEREQQMRREMTTQHGFVNTDQKPYCKQCRTRRHHDKNKNHQLADVLPFGPRTQFVDGRCQNGQPREEKNAKDEGIPESAITSVEGRTRPRRERETTVAARSAMTRRWRASCPQIKSRIRAIYSTPVNTIHGKPRKLHSQRDQHQRTPANRVFLFGVYDGD